jgi:hypothetical protein
MIVISSHRPLAGRTVVVAWALLTRKTKAQYEFGFFEPLRALMDDRLAGAVMPHKIIVTDYEIAIVSAFKGAFPNSTVHGCVFHHKQAVWDAIGRFHLVPLEKSNEDFKKFVHLVLALCYVDPNHVYDFWQNGIGKFAAGRLGQLPGFAEQEAGAAWEPYREDILKFISYISSTWVGTRDKSPLFDPALWSVFRSVKNLNIPATQGGNEVYNLHFTRYVPIGFAEFLFESVLLFLLNIYLNLQGGGWRKVLEACVHHPDGGGAFRQEVRRPGRRCPAGQQVDAREADQAPGQALQQPGPGRLGAGGRLPREARGHRGGAVQVRGRLGSLR